MRGKAGAAGFVLAALLVGGGAILLAFLLASPHRGLGSAHGPGTVPDVVGMTVGEAHEALARAGLGCAVVSEEEGDGGPRLVATQREWPGSRDPRGGIVRLAVSEPYPEDAGYPRDPRAGLLPPGCADLRGGRAR